MNMLQTIKRFWWLVLLVAGVPAAWGFSLLGPNANGGDSWQTPIIGYNPQPTIDLLPTGPKNIGEEYRQNKSVLFYAYDANFLGFFGSNGVASVDQAFVIMNAAFTNNPTGTANGLDGYSSSLSAEFPLYSQHINYEALALGLADIKSMTLWALVEQMGLAWPERYVWVLHQAYLPTGTTPPAVCPADEEFEVVQRNYPVEDSLLNQFQYSPYVNDTLYTFTIFYWPNCVKPAANLAAYNFIVDPVAVDPFAQTFTSVAGTGDQLAGGFYTGLTRDDAAGLRYLLTSNNRNFETPSAGSLLQTTNLGAVGPFVTTSNLSQLLMFSQTNAPTLIPATFPNVVVAGTITNWVTVTNWQIGSYLYSPPGSPYGTQLLYVYSNIVGTAFVPNYVDTFANVITNGNLTNFNATLPANTPGLVLTGTNVVLNYSPNTAATIQTIQIQQVNGAPYGTLATNTSVQNIVISNQPSGEYFVLPPSQCGWRFLSQSPTYSVIVVTNVTTTATNTTTTNAIGFVSSQSVVTYFTNHTFLVQAINCASATPAPGLYQGIEKMRFVRADFDSLLGQFFQPVTNNYTMTLITNSQAVVQQLQRVVTQPDILLSANDEPLTSALPTYNAFGRTISFDQANVLANLAGPGVINSPTTFTYNKAGNLFLNGPMSSFGITTNSLLPYLNELTQSPFGVIWASFDDSTNDPVVYPNGTSISNLVNQMLIQVMPPAGILPDGTNAVPYAPGSGCGFVYTNSGTIYTNTFTATGGAFSPPYTWSLPSGLGGLPTGLLLSGAGVLSGTPTQSGTFDFTIQLTDSLGRSVTWNYQITIH